MVLAIITAEDCHACKQYKESGEAQLHAAVYVLDKDIQLYNLKSRMKVFEEMREKKAPDELIRGVKFVPTLAYSADGQKWEFCPEPLMNIPAVTSWLGSKKEVKKQESHVDVAGAAGGAMRFANNAPDSNRTIRLYSALALGRQ